ncbi:MAG: cadherin repeat domain-containing protein [Gelidibacter sp.]
MKTLKTTLLSSFVLLLLFASCSVKDESANLFSVQNFTTTMSENPSSDQVIGNIQAAVYAAYELRFSISSQSPENAISINQQSGQLIVNDPGLFDFETHPILTATIKVDKVTSAVNGNGFDEEVLDTKTITATVNLTDVDE